MRLQTAFLFLLGNTLRVRMTGCDRGSDICRLMILLTPAHFVLDATILHPVVMGLVSVAGYVHTVDPLLYSREEV